MFGSLLSVLIFTACSNNEKKENTVATTENTEVNSSQAAAAIATLTTTVPDTTLSGTAEFMQENGKVKMILNITCLTMANKSVAVHLHEMGDCGDMGKMAHGHWNPTNQQHGKWGSSSFHSGDIGNVSLDAAGKGTLEMETDLWSMGGDEKTNILNRSVIVHSGVDDFTTQPTGNAGSRIGCGVITKK
ncbi:MAG: superoxide dismutase family protein [Chitinophagaceae bacterium]|nr:superoxide dismutase family protein [Chitinophagaceae bacterium]